MHHYYIAVLNKFNAWATIYYGTNLPKMSKAYAKLENALGHDFKFKLEVDENYDSDCGAFKTYEQVFGEPSKYGTPSLAFDNWLAAIRKEFGDEAN